MTRNHRLAWLLVIAAALPLTGCISQGVADKQHTTIRQLNEQIIDLQQRLEEAQARVKLLQDQQGQGISSLRAQLEQAIADRQQLESALAAAEQRLRDASLLGPMLPGPLSDALAELAGAYPGLMSYDAERGMIKFQSDLTFALGSVEVNPNAQQALSQLATIVNSPLAGAYEVKIVGHTDNVPVSRPETKQRHPTNWHLSVHRAIAVMNVLQRSGVGGERMQVAGYGEYRPVVTNPAKGGAEANRRVEIFLTPMTATIRSAAAPAPAPTPAPAPVSDPASFK